MAEHNHGNLGGREREEVPHVNLIISTSLTALTKAHSMYSGVTYMLTNIYANSVTKL